MTIGSALSKYNGEYGGVEGIAEDVTELMSQLQLAPERTILVGHSMGAIVASRLAMRLRVLGVVLIGPVHPNPGLKDVFEARIATVMKGRSSGGPGALSSLVKNSLTMCRWDGSNGRHHTHGCHRPQVHGHPAGVHTSLDIGPNTRRLRVAVQGDCRGECACLCRHSKPSARYRWFSRQDQPPGVCRDHPGGVRNVSPNWRPSC